MQTLERDKIEATEMFSKDAHYMSKPLSVLRNSIFPALENGKYITWPVKGKSIGFCTYAFLTDNEVNENSFFETAFSRENGDNLHICNFVCNGTRSDIFSFVRHIQKTLSSKYPDKPFASAVRKKNGSQRPAKYVKGLAL